MHIPPQALLFLGLFALADSAPLKAGTVDLSGILQVRADVDLISANGPHAGHAAIQATEKRQLATFDNDLVPNAVVKYSDDEITKREDSQDKVVNGVVRYSDDEIAKREDKVINGVVAYTDDKITKREDMAIPAAARYAGGEIVKR